jgi:branched-subunit amino acid aminotransferase/4-amino-4-deoxychorismate lyase
MKYVFLNGRQVPEADALISVQDRGFRYGDGVFETIPVHDGIPYLWEYHRERLAGGLEALRIACDLQDMREHTLLLLKANGVTEGLLRIQISRGSGSRGYLPSLPASPPTIVIETSERPAPPPDAVTLWLSAVERIPPRALPTRHKLAQGLGSILARMEARDHGYFDALQLGEGGSVAEAGSANIFWRKDGTLFTPSLASGALAGVTRRRIIELSPYPVREGIWAMAHLKGADDVILTNAALGVIAVKKLQPEECSWPGTELARELNELRNQDIDGYTRQTSESLA